MEQTTATAKTDTGLRRTAQNRGEYGRLRLYTWIAVMCAAALALALVFTLWLFGVQVRDSGMAPSIAPGDVILFDRLAKHFLAPARGDIVLFSDKTGEGAYVGRVVGLPGESVAIYEGRVYIGGVLLDERAYAMGACGDMESTAIPEGSFFILPDDRARAVVAADRLIVDASRIRGRALIRVSPAARIGIF